MSTRQFLGLKKAGNDAQVFKHLANIIRAMPKADEHYKKGSEAIAYLHYFYGECHWYVTGKDIETHRAKYACGYAIVDYSIDREIEFDYIDIEDITEQGAELDLNFSPCALLEISRKMNVEILD